MTDMAALIAADKATTAPVFGAAWPSFVACEAAALRLPVYIAAIEAVTGMHRTIDGQWCEHDGFSWPCGTHRALAVLARSTDKEQQ